MTMFKLEGSDCKRGGHGRGQNRKWLVCPPGSLPLPQDNKGDSYKEHSHNGVWECGQAEGWSMSPWVRKEGGGYQKPGE